jgi:hypothetical protein
MQRSEIEELQQVSQTGHSAARIFGLKDGQGRFFIIPFH